MAQVRNPLQVTISVWKALFLREALDRLFDMRAAWLWLFAEPIIHMSFFAFIFSVIRVKEVAGADTVLWIVTGMLAFFLFRRTADQVTHAVDSNKAYFTYRQIKPFDASFMRAVLEGFLMVIVSIMILAGVAMLGRNIIPDKFILVVVTYAGMWLFGLGYGLIASVGMRLIPEMKHLLKIAMMPLYIISGVIWPLHNIPPQYLELIMINPIAHGVELVRYGFSPFYHAVPGTSLMYLYSWALSSVLIGLLLYRRFNEELLMR